ncbi:nicotinamide-nucleotide amidohydrolase family protein [Arcanobacterium phocisimile]|uniref:Nicotinamide-nucleotide amidohydrolase family protein n=1 Tax=Arcanobacterium phocisimile TaxID=1302235 RepID=A0ABX7IJP6_9ACTO|nr:nicotinamide-nucleotide amidohydrolase family protein [Arcanobacterium phocisimile]QRV02754.1 nicotinamide-nucleotide amidohydrolase family protein [Arcanobacterium phocisimile]
MVEYQDDLAHQLLERCAEKGLTIAVAESLTGGQLASTLVSVPGASRVFRGGAVTYATDTKAHVLGVDAQRLADFGPVDREVAKQMAAGVGKLFDVDAALATTGVAGPGPADGHPAGHVWIGLWRRGGDAQGFVYDFDGDRSDVRYRTVIASLSRLLAEIECV